MKELTFRDLRADEIDVRIGTAKEGKGVSLLLYKDARCDQNILDETVGVMNWKKSYELIDGQLFCTIEIWDEDKKQWIGKQDVGVESNTEEVKGRASDAQKRSAFAFGIGRELYTAPFIWITGAGKYDKFWVSEMIVENKKITKLTICRCNQYGDKTDDIAFQYPRGKMVASSSEPKATPAQIAFILQRYKGANLAKLLDKYGVGKVEDLTLKQASEVIEKLKAYDAKKAKNEENKEMGEMSAGLAAYYAAQNGD